MTARTWTGTTILDLASETRIAVAEIDNTTFMTEWRDLQPGAPAFLARVKPHYLPIDEITGGPMDAETAERAFLAACEVEGLK